MTAASSRWLLPSLGTAVVLGGLAAYHNSLSGPFVFDDLGSIPENPSIRHWAPWAGALEPPPGLTVTGRPFLNWSLALNYAFSGTAAGSYHAVNLLIHLLAGLTVLGLVRRLSARNAEPTPADTWRAFLVALLWTVHPLQTESVTYVVQRAESLMGLFYLLTLYCFARWSALSPTRFRPDRGQTSSAPGATRSTWPILSVLCCLCGMATKEVMVTAPVMVLLIDRVFFAASFREGWRRRRGYYLALFSTWILLAGLMIGAGNRAGSVGFESGMSWRTYAGTQVSAIAHYLRLAIFPSPLVFYYGRTVHPALAGYGGPLLVLLVMAALSGYGLSRLWSRRPAAPGWIAAGFLAGGFLILLAPSSSLVPVASETLAEHRMYLPLLAVIAAVVLGLEALASERGVRVIGLVLASALIAGTVARNRVYASELDLWSDTVQHNPLNPVARNDWGEALRVGGKNEEALAQFDAALKLNPGYADAHNNRGVALMALGHPAEAAQAFESALRLNPRNAAAQLNWGNVLQATGNPEAAVGHYRAAEEISPERPDIHFNLGMVLLALRHPTEAIPEFAAVTRLSPGDAEAHNNLGIAWAESGQPGQARAEFESALRLRPDYARARQNLEQLKASLPR